MGVLAAVLPFLITHIPDIVKTVEGIFGKGNGDKKKEVAVSTVMGLLEGLLKAGKIPEKISEDNVGAVIETIFQQLKATGMLGTPTLPVQNPVDSSGGAMSGTLVFQNGRLAGFQPL